MPKNTGHGSRREKAGPSIGVFFDAKAQGGSFAAIAATTPADRTPGTAEGGAL